MQGWSLSIDPHMQCTPRPLNGIIHTPIQVSCIALFDDSIAEPIITRCMVLSPQACFIAEWHAQEQWPIPLKIKRAHNKLANVTRNAEVYSPFYCISSTTCAFCCNTMAWHCRHLHPSVVEHTLKPQHNKTYQRNANSNSNQSKRGPAMEEIKCPDMSNRPLHRGTGSRNLYEKTSAPSRTNGVSRCNPYCLNVDTMSAELLTARKHTQSDTPG